MTSYLTTLQACRDQLLVDSVLTSPDADRVLARLIPVASQLVEDYCGVPFCPVQETREFDIRVAGNELHLKGSPLISATTIKNGDDSTIGATDYVLLPQNSYPKRHLILKIGTYWLFNPNISLYDNPSGFNSTSYVRNDLTSYLPSPTHIADQYLPGGCKITGTWCFHRYYGTAWRTSAITVSGSLSSGATSLTLSASADSDGIDVGSFLQIDSEYLAITGSVGASSPDTGGLATTTVTVARGLNGTTAASHNNGTAIQVWTPETAVEMAAREAVAYLYKRRENAVGETVAIDGLGAVAKSARGLPQYIKDQLNGVYRNFWSGQ